MEDCVDNMIKISSEKMWDYINEKFDQNGGVYILKCSESINDFSPIKINRFLGNDEDGVLYIGKANCFLDRVANLKKSISPNYKSSSHECGSRYKSSEKIKSKFPFDKLYVQLSGSSNPLELEKKYLKKYEDKFGELPPFNRVS